MNKSIPLAGIVLSGLIFTPQTIFAAENGLEKLKAKADAVKTEEANKIAAQTPQPASIPKDIDCDYQIPEGHLAHDALLSKWAEHAAIQSFTFKPDGIDSELNALKTCYTSQGWKAFNEALKASGNLEAIRNNSLTVTSHINGTGKVKNMKDSQWKVSMPLQVTYQNNDKQLQQDLKVDLLVVQEKSGRFGIMQVIAVPKQEK